MENEQEKRKIYARDNYVGLLSSRQGELTLCAKSIGPASDNHQLLMANTAKAKNEYELVRNRLGGRAPHILFETKWILLLASFIVLVMEAFINKILFDMVLLQNSLMSIVASLLASGALVFFAHTAGQMLRQIWSDFHQQFIWKNIVGGCVLIIIVIISVLGIMYMRTFFEIKGALSGNLSAFGEAAKSAFSVGFSQFIKSAFSTSEAVAMGGMNTFALLGAFIVGSYSHDSDYEYDLRNSNLKKIEKQIITANNQFSSSIKKIHRKYDRQLLTAKNMYIDSGGNTDELPIDDIGDQIDVACGNTVLLKSMGSEYPTDIHAPTQKLSWRE